MSSFWQDKINEHIEVVNSVCNDSKLQETMGVVAGVLTDAFKAGNKLLICGNGGSAADAQHIATEFVSRFFLERKALDAVALTVNTSSLTAIANDYSFDSVFSRQVEATGKPGDVLIAISTSGNSKNIVAAIEAAKNIGIKTIGFTGNDASCLVSKMADFCIGIPSSSTPRIQEAHILVAHALCEYVEHELFGKDSNR